MLLVLVAAGQWFIKPADPARVPAPGAHSAAMALFMSSVRPLVERWLWFRFEGHVNGGALPAAIQDLQSLAALGSSDVRPLLHLARFLAWDLAPRAGSAPERIQRVFEAEAILEDAARRFPADPEVHLRHGQILTLPWSMIPALHRIYCNRRGLTPASGAARAFRKGLELAPGSPVLAVLAGDATRIAGIERVLMGDAAGWQECVIARELVLRAGSAVGPLQSLLAEAWARGGEAMQRSSVAEAAVVFGALPLGELPPEEQGFVRALVPALAAGMVPADAAAARLCLPAAMALHTILQATPALTTGGPAPAALRQLALRISQLAPDLKGSLPRELIEER